MATDPLTNTPNTKPSSSMPYSATIPKHTSVMTNSGHHTQPKSLPSTPPHQRGQNS